MKNLSPAYEKNNIPVVVASSAYYAPYMCVTLMSIIKCASKDNNYDLIILHKEISQEMQDKILRLSEKLTNVCIRFIKISTLIDQKKYNFRAGYSAESFYRVVMMEYLSEYEKVVYLDSDVVVKEDIANLYFEANLSDKLVAATRDIDGIASTFYNRDGRRDYMHNYLCLEDVCDYFQSGVMVFNLELFRKTYTLDEIIEASCDPEIMFGDQDVLNKITKGRVYYLNMKWNVVNTGRRDVINNLFCLAPAKIIDEYIAARQEPKIIHYAVAKPWIVPDADMAEDFWNIARLSPFYTEIINRKA